MGLIFDYAKRGLAVFAHPDDESLWCGGLLARGDIEWTVVACSIPPQDPIRAYQFFDACDVLGVRPRLLPFSERDGLRVGALDTTGFDLILTHGEAGEYGHAHHKEIHKFYKEDPRARFIAYGGKPEFYVQLDEVLWAKKLKALHCYRGYTTGDNLLANFGRKFNLAVEVYT